MNEMTSKHSGKQKFQRPDCATSSSYWSKNSTNSVKWRESDCDKWEMQQEIDPEPYGETCWFKQSDETSLFNKQKYEPSISARLSSSESSSVKCLLDAEAGPSLISEDFLHLGWGGAIRAANSRSQRSTTSQKVNKFGAVLIHALIEDDHVRVAFVVVKTLVVSVLLGTLVFSTNW